MAGLVRKQFYVRPAQERFLKQRGRALGVTEAALVRRAIDLLVRAAERETLDARAWDDEQAFLKCRTHGTATGFGASEFNREDSYRERLDNISG